MTSITIAETGPTVHVARKPPAAMSANCCEAALVAEKAIDSTIIDSRHSPASTSSLVRGRRAPALSTTTPQTTLPAAPQSTTRAARTAAASGAIPCTRLRKLGSQAHIAETTTSCAVSATLRRP